MIERFLMAVDIAALQIESGTYAWRPKTTAGWVVRIACTDVGQGAWQEAGRRLAATGSGDWIRALAAAEPCERDLTPDQAQPAAELSQNEQ